ncbi:MAG: prepilin-type N-terminal cleavage/methylation domain-containing protein [Fimbriimonadaceae bacterium]|nr:prepilin-type N-terminal cleavage/methylation domain-containing protein [Fimbriimonadaceae bacterium]QYK54838.1 MAG: prepilin-type N-terminal cleavage/methylation domain-containing protein [Fimbriimonadaceae bacterium]
MTKRSSKRKGFTLVEIMIVVLIIGILLAIAVPNFITARQNSRAQTIIATLRQVEAAKDQCAMDKGLTTGDDCDDTDMEEYMKTYPPEFPVNGTFEKNTIGSDPTFESKTADEWKTDKSGL